MFLWDARGDRFKCCDVMWQSKLRICEKLEQHYDSIKSLSAYKKIKKTPTVHLCVSGAFENGLAEHDIEEALQPISAVRLVVQSDADVWALLSEVWPDSFCVVMCIFLYVSMGVLTHTAQSDSSTVKNWKS